MADTPYHKLVAKADRENYSNTRRKNLVLLIFATVVLLAITICTILFSISHSKNTEQDIIAAEECGTSPSSARRSGCVFDAVLMGWVPWRCYNPAVAASLLAQKDWSFYHTPDFNSTKPPLDEVLAGDWDTLYVEPAFYIAQCIATWRKTWQVAMTSGVLDGYLGDEHHTSHCEMLISKGADLEKYVYMKYASCPRAPGRDLGRFGWYRVSDGMRIYRADA